jgi:hypothetical protein
LKTESGRKRAALLALASMVVAACGGGDGGGPAAVPVVPSVVSGVSGSFTQGGSITIAGSAFGSNADGGPMLYDNFDDATGDIVSSGGTGRVPQVHVGGLSGYTTWVRDGGGDYTGRAITRNNGSPKAHSTWHARMAFDSNLGGFWGLNLRVPYAVDTGDELYVSFYVRSTKTHADFGRQHKSIVWYSSGFNDQGYVSTAYDNCQTFPGWREELLDVSYQGTSGITGVHTDAEWIRQELYFRQGAPGTANGGINFTIYRPSAPAKYFSSSGSIATRSNSLVWSEWTFGGGYYDDCSGVETANIDLDEFYMDDTPARVEVCDSPTWAARNKCELQMPTAWSDTSITATFNIGYLSPGNPAYVYVINAGGGVNAQGFAIMVAP